MKTDTPLFGHLIGLKYGNQTPSMEFLALEVEREEAKGLARMEFAQPYWCGPRQSIFLHRDGTMELWNTQSLSA
jgi:hypothetical protein